MSYRALKFINTIKAIPFIQSFLPGKPLQLQYTYSIPPANIYITGNTYVIDLVLPGLNKEDIHFKTYDHILNLTVNRKATPSAELRWVSHEFNFNCFNRSFRIPTEYNTRNTSVAYDRGILKITFHKTR